MVTEITKVAGSDHHTVVWGSLTTEPPCLSAWTLYCLKVESLDYIFAADSMGLAPKDASFVQSSAVRLFKVTQGRLLWEQLKEM